MPHITPCSCKTGKWYGDFGTLNFVHADEQVSKWSQPQWHSMLAIKWKWILNISETAAPTPSITSDLVSTFIFICFLGHSHSHNHSFHLLAPEFSFLPQWHFLPPNSQLSLKNLPVQFNTQQVSLHVQFISCCLAMQWTEPLCTISKTHTNYAKKISFLKTSTLDFFLTWGSWYFFFFLDKMIHILLTMLYPTPQSEAEHRIFMCGVQLSMHD